jgi:hypothetical protein
MQKNVGSALIILALLAGCHNSTNNPNSDKEVTYVARSSDATVGARILKEGFGATVSDVLSVQLFVDGGQSNEIYRADRVQGLKLRWIDSRHLELDMDCGRIFHYSNFFDVLDKSGSKMYRINITLRSSALCARDSGH